MREGGWRRKGFGLFAALGLAVLAAAPAKAGYPMRSFTFEPSFFGPGVGTRHWETDKWGWGLQVQPSWGFDDLIYTARALYSPKPPTTKKTYLGLGVGGFSLNDDLSFGATTVETSVSSFALQAFVGWEWLRGIRKNQAISFEVGLQLGSAEAEASIKDPTLGTSTVKLDFSLPIIYVGGTYAFYFKKGEDTTSK